MRFFRSTHLLMSLSLETLTSMIRTGRPTLVELIDPVNSVVIFLSQITLLRWFTFRLSLSLSCRFRFISSDASICSTMAFPPLKNFNHVAVSVSIDLPSNSKQDGQFHCITYDYSRAD